MAAETDPSQLGEDGAEKGDEQTANTDDGRRGTLNQPRVKDEGGDGTDDTVADA